MKRLSSLLLFWLATALALRAQSIPTSGPTVAGFIPAGYHELPQGRATGDLNADGRPDVVLALAPDASTEAGPAPATNDNVPFPRLLLVLWRTATGYEQAAVSRRALLCQSCGGALGDPFASLAIAKGVLRIQQRGGSREAWSLTAKFRYQQGEFYQIGDTYDVADRLGQPCPKLPGHYRTGDEHRDMNLVTGSFERVRVAADCQFAENKRGRQPVKPLVRLLDYKPAL